MQAQGKRFVPFHQDPEPDLPRSYIQAINNLLPKSGRPKGTAVQKAKRKLSAKAKEHARPYVFWARELLAQEED